MSAANHPFYIVGHRGATDERLENSLDGFKYALTLGIDGIEDPFGEVSVRIGVVWLGCVTVAEEVDADDVLAPIAEKSGETAPLPSGRERSAPTMNKYHGSHKELTIGRIVRSPRK